MGGTRISQPGWLNILHILHSFVFRRRGPFVIPTTSKRVTPPSLCVLRNPPSLLLPVRFLPFLVPPFGIVSRRQQHASREKYREFPHKDGDQDTRDDDGRFDDGEELGEASHAEEADEHFEEMEGEREEDSDEYDYDLEEGLDFGGEGVGG